MSAKEQRQQQRRQQAIFLIVVLLVILVSVGSGLYFGGIRIGSFGDTGSGGAGVGERYATMTDAHLLCEERAREVFGERIRTLTIDSHSSRLDKKAGLFRIFMESDLYPSDSRQGTAVRHYINCFTRADRVAIASFQYAKDGETMQDPGGSIFGF